MRYSEIKIAGRQIYPLLGANDEMTILIDTEIVTLPQPYVEAERIEGNWYTIDNQEKIAPQYEQIASFRQFKIKTVISQYFDISLLQMRRNFSLRTSDGELLDCYLKQDFAFEPTPVIENNFTFYNLEIEFHARFNDDAILREFRSDFVTEVYNIDKLIKLNFNSSTGYFSGFFFNSSVDANYAVKNSENTRSSGVRYYLPLNEMSESLLDPYMSGSQTRYNDVDVSVIVDSKSVEAFLPSPQNAVMDFVKTDNDDNILYLSISQDKSSNSSFEFNSNVQFSWEKENAFNLDIYSKIYPRYEGEGDKDNKEEATINGTQYIGRIIDHDVYKLLFYVKKDLGKIIQRMFDRSEITISTPSSYTELQNVIKPDIIEFNIDNDSKYIDMSVIEVIIKINKLNT